MNSTERIHRGIRVNADKESKDGFWHTKPIFVAGTGGRLAIALLSARDGNDEKIPEGLYAATNVSPADYQTYPDLQDFVRSHLTRTLFEVADFNGPFDISVAQTAPGGSAILRIEPQIPQ